MRPADPDVIALLASGQPFVFADCFTITLRTGEVLRYTNAQQPVRYTPPGDVTPHTYTSGILIDGLRTRSTRGIVVDEQDCQMSAKSDVLIRGQPFMIALRLGFFDGGYVARDRVYMQTWSSPVLGPIRLFYGRVSTVVPGGGTRAIMKVKSELIVLDQPMPRNTFQTGCQHVLFDAGCKLVKDDFAVTGLVEAASTATQINWASATAGEYDLGTVTFETGPNVGNSRTVRTSDGSALILVTPLEFTPGTGDQFKAYPGCDLTRARCVEFSNEINFRGFPYVPVAETAL